MRHPQIFVLELSANTLTNKALAFPNIRTVPALITAMNSCCYVLIVVGITKIAVRRQYCVILPRTLHSEMRHLPESLSVRLTSTASYIDSTFIGNGVAYSLKQKYTEITHEVTKMAH